MAVPVSSFNQGRYQVQRLLGKGGMGAVYLVQDTRLGNLVAVKENLDTTLEARQQFATEARILANLSHPCLPRVSDSFIEPTGKQYLVMEYVEGDDLEQLLTRRGALTEAQVAAWACSICEALAYMHGRQPDPVIHRDIKPANIKLTPGGQVKLVDFGIAKVFRAGQKTVSAARAATDGYSPPEQYGLGTDARSDIYALGATMYHLLTGQAPPAAIAITPARPLTSPRQLNPALSPRVEQVILCAMAFNAADRYQTADAMKQALTPAPSPRSICPSCGASNRTGAQFCNNCGARLSPAASIRCPHCTALNRPAARSCSRCGKPLNRGVAPAPIIPSPPRASEHRIAGWILLGLGPLTLLALLLWPAARLQGMAPMAVGIVAALLAVSAARDLLELGARQALALPYQLRFLMGSRDRGRRLGVIAAVLIVVLTIGQAWTILPLLLTALAAYVVSILTTREAVTACRGIYDRPAGATLIGWGLVFSGIGTLPGIGLLIPQPWARRGAMAALVILATLGGLACIAVAQWGLFVPANSTPLAQEVAFTLMGIGRVRAYSLSALCYALAMVAGSAAGIRYLHRQSAALAAVAASAQRELTAAAWILLGIGIFDLVAPYAVWPAATWGLLPRGWVALPALLCLVAGRDLLQVFQARSRYWPDLIRVLFGSVARGRSLGVIAALASSAVFLGLAWLIVPLALAVAMFYVICILVNPAVAARCGSRSSIPPGASLIAWLLIPTGVGALPGIALLTTRQWARKAAIVILAGLAAAGLLLLGLALYQGFEAAEGSSYLSQIAALPFVQIEARVNALAAGSYGLALAAGCAAAIRYLQSSAIRTFYGA